MQKLPMIIVVAGLLTANTTTPSEIIGPDQLAPLATKARSFKPVDQFDTTLPSGVSLDGKHFSYTVAPLPRGPNNSICPGFPSWGYWPEDARLEVGADFGLALTDTFTKHGEQTFANLPKKSGGIATIEYYTFSCDFKKLPSYTATNAYNAEFTIDRTKQTVTAVANFDYAQRPWKVAWSTKITGDAARQLTQNLRIRISGILEDWAPGTPVICGTDAHNPSIISPTDDTVDLCLIKARTDHLEFFNAVTGEVLYSATR
ncbi:MAG: hypothetical protein JWO15_989 [Sphingomonadales bacterium]|nr:hypothetical protein [Sphingomonadales bacterium]